MKIVHLKSKDLAARWNITESTLEQWRWFGKGPSFLKLGTLILYRMKEIEQFEHLALHRLMKDSHEEICSRTSFESQEEEQNKMSP